jgi:hypothetical protein
MSVQGAASEYTVQLYDALNRKHHSLNLTREDTMDSLAKKISKATETSSKMSISWNGRQTDGSEFGLSYQPVLGIASLHGTPPEAAVKLFGRVNKIYEHGDHPISEELITKTKLSDFLDLKRGELHVYHGGPIEPDQKEGEAKILFSLAEKSRQEWYSNKSLKT